MKKRTHDNTFSPGQTWREGLLSDSQSTRKFRYSVAGILIALATMAIVGLILTFGAMGARAAPAAGCASPNVPTDITTDTTLSGDLYVGDHVYVSEGVVLTITAGSQVTVCGEYSFDFDRKSRLVAEGTAAQPITFTASSGNWGQIDLGWETYSSTLRYVTLKNGGGSDPNATYAALNIKPLGNTPDTAGPVVDHVTVEDSGAYGVIVGSYNTDKTPPALSNLTVRNSAAAPILMQGANDVGGLGTGNTFTDNVTNTIQVKSWSNVVHSQTWHAQPIPYQLMENISVDSAITPVLTIEAGADVILNPDVSLTIGRPGGLIAEGTADAPITFDSAVTGQKWGQIHLGWEAAAYSRLRYVTLKNGGSSTPTAKFAALEVEPLGNTPDTVGPVIDHVTVEDSGAYGIIVDSYNADKTPPALSNLTVTNSAGGAMLIDAADVAGLGSGNTISGNLTDTIQLMSSSNRIYYTHTWQAQSVPYEVLSNISIRGGVLTIEAGAEFLMHENVDVTVGSLYGKGGLIAEGTAAAPIVFRPAGSTAWGSISFDGAHQWAGKNALFHTQVRGGGGASGSRNGAVSLNRAGALRLNNVTVGDSTGTGVYSTGDLLVVEQSTIEGNRIGMRFNDENARGLLRDNLIRSNSEDGLVNDWPTHTCIEAIGNYWGSADGPADSSAAADACNSTATNTGSGDAVSDGVRYDPWLTGVDGGGTQDSSSISPDTYWIIADGVHTTTLTIRAQAADGTPLVGKQIELKTTRGTIQQPAEPTDENGVTTAVISSTETGGAVITGRNITDGTPLGGIASVNFWQGLGETAGLIDPGGVPYASPQLILEGQPFQQGFPMTFRLPMQNSNAEPVDVKVSYSVSHLTIGGGFTEVATATKTLAPGESWDAEVIWYPPLTGHRCTRATMEVTIPAAGNSTQAVAETVDVGPFQVNFDVPDDPCEETDVDKLIPSSAGLKGVRKHMTKALIQSYLVKECLKQELTFGSSSVSALGAAAVTAQRDYEIIVTPPDYTPPALEPGTGVSQAQAEAATAVGEVAADLAGLNEALMETSRRIRWAGQAGDDAAAARQLDAYRDFKQQYADKLDELAAAIDDLLAVTEGAGEPDTTFMPADYDSYVESLRTSGYAQDVIDFHRAAGLTDAQIEAMLQAEINRMQAVPAQPITFYESLRAIHDAARDHADDIRANYAQAALQGASSASAVNNKYFVDTLEASFVVGNPKDSQQTVELQVRPVDLPIDWSYSLDQPVPTLAAGETTTVTLTIEPGSELVADDSVRVAVEGFIGEEYVGGILFERSVPTAGHRVFLPLVLR